MLRLDRFVACVVAGCPLAAVAAPLDQSIGAGGWGSWGGPPPFSEWDGIQIEYDGIFSAVHAEAIDFDGAGPREPVIVAYGEFTLTEAGPARIGIFDGATWELLPPSLGMADVSPNDFIDISAVCAYDVDGTGPQPKSLVYAARNWETAESGVFAWTTGSLTALTPGSFIAPTIPQITSLLPWDPDGPGPQDERLVVSGYFLNIGPLARNSVSDFDGVTWGPFGGGFWGQGPYGGGPAHALNWDPDGSGPMQDQVLLYGGFGGLGGLAAPAPIAWNGSVATALSLELPGSDLLDKKDLWTIDPDGPGGEPAMLVAAGSFVPPGAPSSETYVLCVNDGTSTMYIGRGVASKPERVCWWDADGQGPADGRFLVYTRSGNITPLGGQGAKLVTITRSGVIEAIPLGNAAPQDVVVREVGGQQTLYSLETLVGMKAWNGTSWDLLTEPFGFKNLRLRGRATFDPDGEGPEPESVVINDMLWNGQDAPSLLWLREDGFEPFNLSIGGPTGSSTSLVMAQVDLDGPGGEAPAMLFSGYDHNMVYLLRPGEHGVLFSTAPWNVVDLATWDRDGDGPQPAVPVALSKVFNTVQHIAVFENGAWTTVATVDVIRIPGQNSTGLMSIFGTLDFDGAGTGTNELVVSGRIAGAQGGPVEGDWRIASFDGVRWAPRGPSNALPHGMCIARFTDGLGRPAPRLFGVFGIGNGQNYVHYVPTSPDTGEWHSLIGVVPSIIPERQSYAPYGDVVVDVNGVCGGGEAMFFCMNTSELQNDELRDLFYWDGGPEVRLFQKDIIEGSTLCAFPRSARPGSPARLVVKCGGSGVAGVPAGGIAYFEFPFAGCPGDSDCDGRTNAVDFVIMAGSFGQSGRTHGEGDLNGDGLVNAADFVILAGDFGCDAN